MKHRITLNKSWEKQFSRSITRPVFKSSEKRPTIKLAHSPDDEQRLKADVNFGENHDSIQPLVDLANSASSDKLVDKQENIISKIENIGKKVELAQQASENRIESESQKSEILPELFSEIHDLYDDAVELHKETSEVVDDIKHGRIDEVVDDLSEIVEDSREIVGETRKIIKDFKYLYGVIAGLTPIFVWGLSMFVFKKPK